MDNREISTIVRAQVEELIGVPADFDDGDLLADHGLDSLSGVELTLRLEEVFDVTFEDEELSFDHFATVRDIVGLVSGKKALV
ncbi:acyl carrier protein [Streptomyces sp. TG1A-8]|uniref:acyl carrier protein n=1 Tax=Streptomyces sp. TG1A-8 TaxID=3051385 RepID=UPI00265BC0FB|nr:acyl carrier protein [Streptomyces sp. TG1A-8]MDO0925019.1 acyl carrier protein [Streptomyces sp. TG1A-8]